MRRFGACAFALAVLLSTRPASAGTIVFDPAPLNETRSSDLPEDGGAGLDERYQFSGSARNDASGAIQLTLTARANGVDIPGSQQTFTIQALSTTSFNYDYTYANHLSPAQVGLTFASTAPLNFVAGVFSWTHDAAPVPAVPWPAAAALVLGLLLCTRQQLARRPTEPGVDPLRR